MSKPKCLLMAHENCSRLSSPVASSPKIPAILWMLGYLSFSCLNQRLEYEYSPSGAVPLTSFAIALGFLGCRLGFVLALAGTVAWTTADAVRSMLSARDAS